jgi:hypothetical protein
MINTGCTNWGACAACGEWFRGKALYILAKVNCKTVPDDTDELVTRQSLLRVCISLSSMGLYDYAIRRLTDLLYVEVCMEEMQDPRRNLNQMLQTSLLLSNVSVKLGETKIAHGLISASIMRLQHSVNADLIPIVKATRAWIYMLENNHDAAIESLREAYISMKPSDTHFKRISACLAMYVIKTSS